MVILEKILVVLLSFGDFSLRGDKFENWRYW